MKTTTTKQTKRNPSTQPQPAKPPAKRATGTPSTPRKAKRKPAKSKPVPVESYSQTPTITPPIPKRKRGNVSKFTTALADEICKRISSGETMTSICTDSHMPNPATVWRWGQEHETFAQDIACARNRGYDAIADECVRIADGRDGDDPQSRRIRVETRLKLLAKWDPKRYGERIEQHIEVETGPNTLASLQERAKHVRSGLNLAHRVPTERN